MADSFFSFSLILHALLIWLTWKVFSKLYAHVRLIARIKNSGVPTIKAYPVVGILPIICRCILFGPKDIPTNAALLAIPLGSVNVFRKEGICRLDFGWFKQVILVYTKEGAEALLNDPGEQKKSNEYKYISDFVGSGLITASYGMWKKHRRVLSPAFNPRIIDSFQPVMYRHAHLLARNIKSNLHSEPIFIEDLLSRCSLGVVTETAMGIKFGSHSEKYLAYVTAVREVLLIIGRRLVAPWLWPEPLFRVSPSGLKLRKTIKKVHSFVREIIQKKKADIKEGSLDNPLGNPGFKYKPFLELMLLHNLSCGEADRLTDEEILDETLTFTFAGFDTVSVTLHWTIYYLGLYPEVMKRAWTEVNVVLQGEKEREITLDDLKKMDYLENVIKETLRVRPAVPALMRILRHDIKVGEITLPKGATVVVGSESLHRCPESFPDGVRYDPDRFTDKKLNSFQYVPFSAGPRNCIGQRLAVLEMKTVLSHLIRHLNWKSIDQADTVLSNPDLVNRAHKPLKIHFWERP